MRFVKERVAEAVKVEGGERAGIDFALTDSRNSGEWDTSAWTRNR